MTRAEPVITRLEDAVKERNALRAALDSIKRAAVAYGVNDEVGAAIAHADLVVRRARTRRLPRPQRQ